MPIRQVAESPAGAATRQLPDGPYPIRNLTQQLDNFPQRDFGLDNFRMRRYSGPIRNHFSAYYTPTVGRLVYRVLPLQLPERHLPELRKYCIVVKHKDK